MSTLNCRHWRGAQFEPGPANIGAMNATQLRLLDHVVEQCKRDPLAIALMLIRHMSEPEQVEYCRVLDLSPQKPAGLWVVQWRVRGRDLVQSSSAVYRNKAAAESGMRAIRNRLAVSTNELIETRVVQLVLDGSPGGGRVFGEPGPWL